MKKIAVAISALCTLGYLPLGLAGSMDSVASSQVKSTTPFASLEASHTWNQFNGFHINSFLSSKTSEPWGGRFAVGVARPISDVWSLSGEVGGGYYGQTKPSIAEYLDIRYNIDGYDFLAGGIYKINQFEVFGKVGFMVENIRARTTANFARLIPGGFVSGTATKRFNRTEALPQIKVGGNYNLSNNWSVSLAYLHVFGSNMHSNNTISASPGSFEWNGESNLEVMTLNSIMFGLRYNFA
ncbi:MAG: hypothetical protein Q8R83_02240 [Legionellaceae bacterium]|nr:hypothetical protein [Legionellaceae bacterium]